MLIFNLSKSLYLRTLFCDLISLRASCPFDISHDSSRLFQMENLLPDVRVLGATSVLAEPETFSKPVSGCRCSRSRLVASLAEPLPYLRRWSKCYLILNKPNFSMGPSQKLCGFLSVYAHPEIVHSRPRLFKRCIAPSTR